MAVAVKQMVGEKFGNLTVISESSTSHSNGEKKYLCRCECGKEKEIRGSNLRSGHTTSCGCGGRRNITAEYKAADVARKMAMVTGGNITMGNVPLNLIHPIRNIRRSIDTTEPRLLELAENIRQVGIIESLVVNEREDNGTYLGEYDLVAGYRRYTAAKLVGREDAPVCIHRGLGLQDILEIQISENLHRLNMSVIEEADVYARMRDELNLPVENIATRIGKSPAHVYQFLALLKLSDAAKDKIDSGDIGIAKAVALCSLSSTVVERIVSGDLQNLLELNSTAFLREIKARFVVSENDTNTETDGRAELDKRDGDGSVQQPKVKSNKERGAYNDDDDGDDLDDDSPSSEDIDEDDEDVPLPEDIDEDDEDVNNEMIQRARDCVVAKQRKMEYYLDISEKLGNRATDLIYVVGKMSLADGWRGPRLAMEAETRDALCVKYIGKTFETVFDDNNADEVIRATIIHHMLEEIDCDEESITEWLGCSEYEPEGEDSDE